MSEEKNKNKKRTERGIICLSSILLAVVRPAWFIVMAVHQGMTSGLNVKEEVMDKDFSCDSWRLVDSGCTADHAA